MREDLALGEVARMLHKAGLGVPLRGDKELEIVVDVVIEELGELPRVVKNAEKLQEDG